MSASCTPSAAVRHPNSTRASWLNAIMKNASVDGSRWTRKRSAASSASLMRRPNMLSLMSSRSPMPSGTRSFVNVVIAIGSPSSYTLKASFGRLPASRPFASRTVAVTTGTSSVDRSGRCCAESMAVARIAAVRAAGRRTLLWWPMIGRMGRALLIVLLASLAAAQTPDAARTFIQSDQERFVRELITLTEIPSPPFKEQARAAAFANLLRLSGLANVETDAEGNVTALRKGAGRGVLVVNAHLDTVFPEGTNVTVKRQGTRLSAPGVGDDTRGLALLLSLVRAMDAAKIQTASDILFVGNVGEEGEGDLRGIKYLLQKGTYKGRVTQMIAIDGGDARGVTRGGVGSKRYRVAFTGPGGHSYGAFGLVNPAYAMGDAIARFSRLSVPSKPKTTFNVGVVRGGTSVNSIPSEVSMDIDMRSESCAELQKLDVAFLGVVRDAVDAEN